MTKFYLGHKLTDNLCDESDIKIILGWLRNIMLRQFFNINNNKNSLHLYLYSLWAKYRKPSILHFRLGQISNNVPRKSPVGIFEEKGANHFF